MRLKEPLQGIKMAQMHLVMHLTFFVTMTINGLSTQGDLAPEDLRGAYHDTISLTDDEVATYYELAHVCRIFYFGHLAMFITQLLTLYLKRYAYYNLAQFLVAIVTPVGYIWPLF